MPKQVFNRISEDRKAKLLKSSVKEFTRKPYDKITVASLTDTMKILRTDFYYYFYDKEDIYQALIDRFEKVVKDKNSEATYKEALNILFEKIAKLDGTRNRQYLIDITENYHPQFAYELVKRLEKIFPCKCDDNKKDAKHLIAIYRLMTVVNLYAKGKVSIVTVKELLNE